MGERTPAEIAKAKKLAAQIEARAAQIAGSVMFDLLHLSRPSFKVIMLEAVLRKLTEELIKLERTPDA